MRNRFGRCIYTFFTLFLLFATCFVLFTGCQSTDKHESYLDSSNMENAQFTYDADSNQTKVVWKTTLTNNTIYNFNDFSVTVNLFHNSTLVKTETYYYDIGVKHGATFTGNFNFYAENEIDSVEFVSWNANYDSLWGTYKVWFIVAIVLVCVAALIYIIIMVIQDLELDEIWDFLQDYWWVLFSILVPLGGTIWGVVTSNWVPALIIASGVVALVIICVVAHLIKYIVDWGGVGVSIGRIGQVVDVDQDEERFDPKVEDIEDYIDDRNKLMLFSANKLKEYCRNNGIKGYSSLSKSSIVDLIVNSGDKESNAKQEKNTKKSVVSQNRKITFDDIAGLEEAKNAFREKVVYAFEHKDLYEKYGKKIGGGLLLYGLPGTGKTMFAEAASNETDSLFIPIKCSDIKSKWYGESEANVKKIFEKARKAKKAIIFFDEFEAIGAKRTDNSDNGNNDLVPQILAEMQGIGSSSATSIIMVIAATNKPWAIDSAFLRPGRFDEKIYVPLPDFEARKKLFEFKLKTVPQEGLDIEYLANATDGFNGADIGAFCDKLKMLAINKSITTGAECPITMDEVAQVQGSIKSSVSNEDIELLLAFKEQYI